MVIRGVIAVRRDLAGAVPVAIVVSAMVLSGGSTLVAAPEPCHPHPDVTSSDTHCPSIAWLKNQHVTYRYADGTFGPNKAATRNAMAAFLYRPEAGGAKQPECAGPPFWDVTDNLADRRACVPRSPYLPLLT